MNLFNTVSLVVILLKLLQFWYLSEHRWERAFHAQLAAYSGYAALELFLWSRDWALWGLGLFVLLDIAGVVSAMAGLHRRN